MAVTVKKLADELRVSVGPMKAFLRGKGFASAGRDLGGGDSDLTRDEERALREAGANSIRDFKTERLADLVPVTSAPVVEAFDADLRDLQRAVAADEWLPPGESARHPIFLHQDVIDALDETHTPLGIRKAAARRLQELMAHGRASRMKGVRGANAGWLRIPLGGNSGFHDYLWLLNHGDKVARQNTAALHAQFPPGSRLVRAIRHHDETSKLLRIGSRSDYMQLTALEAQAQGEGSFLANPLVQAQCEIVAGTASVRLVQGQPGAGKTTALLASSMTLRGRALYLTWSERLANLAREWLETHAPEDLQVTVWTFSQLLRELDPNGSSADSRSIAEGAGLLRSKLATHAHQLGPWWRDGELRAEELFAELRAHYVGEALPIAFRGRDAQVAPHLSDDDYAASRRKLGLAAVKGTLVAAKALSEDLAALFPQPSAAFTRAFALQQGSVKLDPTRFAFESVLVDEVQDLTLTEQWLLLDVVARSGVAAGVRPIVVIAGDESQTVRPTGFRWGSLADLVRARFGDGACEGGEHRLRANLRSPSEVADVIRRARKLYTELPKKRRPSGCADAAVEDATVGRVVQVSAPDDAALEMLIRAFGDAQADAALIYPGPVVPERLSSLAERYDTTIWSADMAKGLEFRVVAVVGFAAALEQIKQLLSSAHQERLACEFARSEIDRLVVALSRTTETLVLVADSWGEEQQRLAAHLLRPEENAAAETEAEAEGADGTVMEISCEDVVEIVDADATDVRERIESLVSQSQQLSEQKEMRSALSTAKRAVALLGRAGRPGAAGPELRQRARRQFGRCLSHSALTDLSPTQLKEAARQFRLANQRASSEFLRQTATALGGDPAKLATNKALRSLAAALPSQAEREESLTSPLVSALLAHVESLVEAATVPDTMARRTALREAVALLAEQAPSERAAFARASDGVVVNMLRELATAGNPKDEYDELRTFAAHHGELPVLDAQRAETLRDYDRAASLWRDAKMPEDALRCLRTAGDITAAAGLASAVAAPDAALMEWAQELVTWAERRPSGSFTAAESKRLMRELEGALRSSGPSQ